MAESKASTQSSLHSTPDVPIGYVTHHGDNLEYVILGNKKYLKHELMAAFGGTMNPGVQPYPTNQFANPAPLGLSAFAFTTFVLSMYNAKAMGITIPNVVVSAACIYGGAIQFLAGVWELAIGNTFGGTALASYGSFWLSFSAIYIESFGIAAAYEDPQMFENAVGFYLIGWAIVTFMFVLTTSKSTVMFFALFAFLCLTFILLGIGSLTGKEGVTRAGGVVGVITAFLGWYNAFAGVADKTNSYVVVHSLPLPGNHFHI